MLCYFNVKCFVFYSEILIYIEMRKILSIILLVLVIAIASIKIGANKNEQMSDLLLRNIECLATPEDYEPNCWGHGTIDCPSTYDKVYVYFNEGL